jgi:hypothetical protein
MIEIRHKRTGALILEALATPWRARLPQAALHGGTLRGADLRGSTCGLATSVA